MYSNAVQDIEALRQVMETFGKDYKIQRKKIVSVNERGRLDNVEQIDNIFAVIQPSNKRINTNSNGQGRWITSESTITVITPEYFSMGDIIFVPGMGRMKVIQINDVRIMGSMTGELIRTGTTDNFSQRDNKPYEPN